eukprot:ANDGO_06222.mRNA.1 hypothetical protein
MTFRAPGLLTATHIEQLLRSSHAPSFISKWPFTQLYLSVNEEAISTQESVDEIVSRRVGEMDAESQALNERISIQKHAMKRLRDELQLLEDGTLVLEKRRDEVVQTLECLRAVQSVVQEQVLSENSNVGKSQVDMCLWLVKRGPQMDDVHAVRALVGLERSWASEFPSAFVADPHNLHQWGQCIRGLVDWVVAARPNVQSYVLKLLSVMTEPENDSEIGIGKFLEAKGLPVLLRLLSSINDGVKAGSCLLLSHIARSASHRSVLDELVGPVIIPALLHMLNSPMLFVLEKATFAIWPIASSSNAHRTQIAQHNGLEAILDCLSQCTEDPEAVVVVENIAIALGYLTRNETIKERMRSSGGLKILVDLLRLDSPVSMGTRGKIAGAIWNCASNEDNKKLLPEIGAIEILIRLCEVSLPESVDAESEGSARVGSRAQTPAGEPQASAHSTTAVGPQLVEDSKLSDGSAEDSLQTSSEVNDDEDPSVVSTIDESVDISMAAGSGKVESDGELHAISTTSAANEEASEKALGLGSEHASAESETKPAQPASTTTTIATTTTVAPSATAATAATAASAPVDSHGTAEFQRERIREVTSVHENAIGALWNLGVDVENKHKIREYGGIDALVVLCETYTHRKDIPSRHTILENITGTLWNLTSVSENRVQMRKCGGLDVFVDTIRNSESLAVLENAVSCVRNCALNDTNKQILGQIGLIPILLGMCAETTHFLSLVVERDADSPAAQLQTADDDRALSSTLELVDKVTACLVILSLLPANRLMVASGRGLEFVVTLGSRSLSIALHRLSSESPGSSNSGLGSSTASLASSNRPANPTLASSTAGLSEVITRSVFSRSVGVAEKCLALLRQCLSDSQEMENHDRRAILIDVGLVSFLEMLFSVLCFTDPVLESVIGDKKKQLRDHTILISTFLVRCTDPVMLSSVSNSLIPHWNRIVSSIPRSSTVDLFLEALLALYTHALSAGFSALAVLSTLESALSPLFDWVPFTSNRNRAHLYLVSLWRTLSLPPSSSPTSTSSSSSSTSATAPISHAALFSPAVMKGLVHLMNSHSESSLELLKECCLLSKQIAAESPSMSAKLGEHGAVEALASLVEWCSTHTSPEHASLRRSAGACLQTLVGSQANRRKLDDWKNRKSSRIPST